MKRHEIPEHILKAFDLGDPKFRYIVKNENQTWYAFEHLPSYSLSTNQWYNSKSQVLYLGSCEHPTIASSCICDARPHIANSQAQIQHLGIGEEINLPEQFETALEVALKLRQIESDILSLCNAFRMYDKTLPQIVFSKIIENPDTFLREDEGIVLRTLGREISSQISTYNEMGSRKVLV